MRYKRHYKVAKVLAALTIAFVICWSPSMVTRTMLYFHFTNGGYVWRASQLLILLNTVLDPILYRVYGEAMRQYARSLFKKTRRPLFHRVDPLRGRQERVQVTDLQATERYFMKKNKPE